MADTELQAPPSEGQRLYCAWRTVRAQWEMETYSPENAGGDLPNEVEKAHCDADYDALRSYLAHPAATLHELARKLRVFRQEDARAYDCADELIDVLVNDALSLAVSDSIERNRGPGLPRA